MRTGFFLVGGAALLAVIWRAPTTARADTHASAGKDRRFWSARAGVGLDTPPGWTLSLHTGYPNVLCVLTHPGGSRLSLAVDKTTALDATALFEQSRHPLAAEGLTIDRVGAGPLGGVLADSRAMRGKRFLRQLYLVRTVDERSGGHQAVILTLTTSDLAAASSAFDFALAHLDLQSPTLPDDGAPSLAEKPAAAELGVDRLDAAPSDGGRADR